MQCEKVNISDVCRTTTKWDDVTIKNKTTNDPEKLWCSYNVKWMTIACTYSIQLAGWWL